MSKLLIIFMLALTISAAPSPAQELEMMERVPTGLNPHDQIDDE